MTTRPWHAVQSIPPADFRCGHCGREVASNQGWLTVDSAYRTHVCPRCNRTTFYDSATGSFIPGAPYGSEIGSLPHELAALYKEARGCVQASAYTAAVLTCRKMLMHIAVEQGAPEGQSFIRYVEYLADEGYVPPTGRKWVDHIRRRGNEANHEIQVMELHDAEELVSFVEMLLKVTYEFPSLVPDEPVAS